MASANSVVLDRARVPDLVLGVLQTLRAAGKQAFLAGGSVRDLARLALGQIEAPRGERWPPDFDVATDALPEEVMKFFPRAIGTGLQHGTVTVLARSKEKGGAAGGGAAVGDEHKVEVTTFRGEGPYLDGRRPSSVTFLGDIDGDLSRRDFTVNAMAWDPLAPGPGGELRDPFGGLADLQRHLLRAVGAARDRFDEDGLRPMRAVRFAATLRLALEAKTARAISETLDTFSRVAKERVRDELEKLLLRGRPASRGVRLLLRTGLLDRIAPGLAEAARRDRPGFRRKLRALDAAPASLPVRAAVLFELGDATAAAALCDALRFPARQRDRVALLVREGPLAYLQDWSDGDCRRAMARITPAALDDFFALRRAQARADGAPAREEPMIARWQHLLAAAPPLSIQALAIDGDALMRALQIPPGRQLGQVLRTLLERVLDDPSLNTPDAMIRLASDIVRRQSTGNPQA